VDCSGVHWSPVDSYVKFERQEDSLDSSGLICKVKLER